MRSPNGKQPKVVKTKKSKGYEKNIEYFRASLIKKPKPAKKGLQVLDGSDLIN